MLDSGGMPSSHSATVSALALAVGLQEGAGSPAFAIAVVLSCIVRTSLMINYFPIPELSLICTFFQFHSCCVLLLLLVYCGCCCIFSNFGFDMAGMYLTDMAAISYIS